MKSYESKIDWKVIRIRVLDRDNHICKICGRKGKEIHHLDGSGSNCPTKEKNNNLENLITVCHYCHIHLHILKLKGKGFSKGKWEEEKERNNKIIKMLKKFSQTEISKIMGITRQRVNQIIKKNLTTKK